MIPLIFQHQLICRLICAFRLSGDFVFHSGESSEEGEFLQTELQNEEYTGAFGLRRRCGLIAVHLAWVLFDCKLNYSMLVKINADRPCPRTFERLNSFGIYRLHPGSLVPIVNIYSGLGVYNDQTLWLFRTIIQTKRSY